MKRSGSQANLTVKLNAATLRKLRIEAAGEGKSMSRLLGEMIEARTSRGSDSNAHAVGLRGFMAGPLLDISAKGMPRADERNAR